MSLTENNVSVLMLMGQQCSFCGPMMQQLTALMKSGLIAELRIVNIEQSPQLAKELGVRSVPWLRVGPFSLQGMRSKAELEDWLQRAADFSKGGEAARAYFEEVLAEGNIRLAEQLIAEYPQAMSGVIALLADADAKINVRLGVGVLMEQMAAEQAFEPYIPQLAGYLSHADARVRGDACHYLSLTGRPELVPEIEKLLQDDSEEVREIAQESLEELQHENRT